MTRKNSKKNPKIPSQMKNALELKVEMKMWRKIMSSYKCILLSFKTEVRKFITKASSEKYKNCKRILITKDIPKLQNKLLKLIVNAKIKLVML